MSELLRHLVRGDGPAVLFIHGSAADHQTWFMQIRGLSNRLRCIAYDRRGESGHRVEDHAADAARLIDEVAGGPVVIACSSFGGVVGLELARSFPDRVRGALLYEPPLPAGEHVAAAPIGFGCHFDRLVAERGGTAAAELFLRAALGDAAFDRLPISWRDRVLDMWPQIRADIAALSAYRPRYDQLAAVRVPFVLAGGDRAGSRFWATLEALRTALPDAELVLLPGAGHAAHADSHHAFNRVLLELVTRVS